MASSTLRHKWLDKLVSDLPPECLIEAGNLLSHHIRPNYQELAGRMKLSMDFVCGSHTDSPGYKVLCRYQQLPDSAVIALIHILEAMERFDVIRIIYKYIDDPCSFTISIREEHGGEHLYDLYVESFAEETIRSALESNDKLKDIPFPKLRYIGETVIRGPIANVKCSVFQGRQVKMEMCACNMPLQETHEEYRRERSNTTGAEGPRPRHTPPTREANSMIPEHTEVGYQRLARPDDHTPPDVECDLHHPASRSMDAAGAPPGAYFGNTMRRRPSGNRILLEQSMQRESATSDDSGRHSAFTQRSSTGSQPRHSGTRLSDLEPDRSIPGDSRHHSPDTAASTCIYDETLRRLSDVSLGQLPHAAGRDSGISVGSKTARGSTVSTDRASMDFSLHSDPPLHSGPSVGKDMYLTTTTRTADQENVYENVEPPGFHDNIRTNKQIDAILGPYRHRDNFFITRRSSSQPQFNRSISITYKQEIVNFRIHVIQSETRCGLPHFSYSLFEKTGPFFASMDDLFNHYRTSPLTESGLGDGPLLIEAVEPQSGS